MRKFLLALGLFAAVSAPELVQARSCGDVPIVQSDGTAFTGVDISGGAVTTGEFDTNGVSQIKWKATITDADNLVTNVRLTFTESDDLAGTHSVIGQCVTGATTGELDCDSLKINWDPTSGGKIYSLSIPWNAKHTKITVTPTGHGAGDEVTLTAQGCW